MGATSTAFDVLCQDPITPERHEVRSLQATKERTLPLLVRYEHCSEALQQDRPLIFSGSSLCRFSLSADLLGFEGVYGYTMSDIVYDAVSNILK